MKISKFIISLVFLMALTTSSYAETTVAPEVDFVLNTLLFIMGGFFVMWMAADFYAIMNFFLNIFLKLLFEPKIWHLDR